MLNVDNWRIINSKLIRNNYHVMVGMENYQVRKLILKSQEIKFSISNCCCFCCPSLKKRFSSVWFIEKNILREFSWFLSEDILWTVQYPKKISPSIVNNENRWEEWERWVVGCFELREDGKSFSYNKLTYSINIDGVSRCPLNVCSYKANMNHYDTTTVFYSQSRSLYLLTLFINCFTAVFARTS